MKRYASLAGAGVLALGCLTTIASAQESPVIQRTEPDGGVSNRYFRFGAKNIPHPDKLHKGGEDAWVAQSDLIVVADGVGGWANQGIDSGLFSKQLVKDIKSLFDLNPAWELKQILADAVLANKNTGSSTCVLVKFDTSKPDTLKATNLGDSGYLLVRPQGDGTFETIFRTKEQQFSFNFPYQCGTGAEGAPY